MKRRVAGGVGSPTGRCGVFSQPGPDRLRAGDGAAAAAGLVGKAGGGGPGGERAGALLVGSGGVDIEEEGVSGYLE